MIKHIPCRIMPPAEFYIALGQAYGDAGLRADPAELPIIDGPRRRQGKWTINQMITSTGRVVVEWGQMGEGKEGWVKYPVDIAH